MLKRVKGTGGDGVTLSTSFPYFKHKTRKNTQHHRRERKQHLGFDFFVFSLQCDIITIIISHCSQISGNVKKAFIKLRILPPMRFVLFRGHKKEECIFFVLFVFCLQINCHIITELVFVLYFHFVLKLQQRRAPQLQQDRTHHGVRVCFLDFDFTSRIL